MSRRRHRHPITRALTRNPTYMPWLLLGGVVAAAGAYYLFTKKKAASGGTTPPGGGGTLPMGDCQKKLLEILPLAVLTSKDIAVCKANPQANAEVCARATANQMTVDGYMEAAKVVCVPGTPPYSGTLPPIPAGLPQVSAACQQKTLEVLALGQEVDRSKLPPSPAVLAKLQTLSAELEAACGIPAGSSAF